MKRQVYNPYLPLNEYIPDGEPHVFGDRVYIYGSHDVEGGDEYCMGDYVTYSAPVSDLTDWRYEGVIYKADRDPMHDDGANRYMYAPDVVRGNDGRYYLYYCFGGAHLVHVAVCDSPCGDFQYHGLVRNPDGSPLTRFIPGDPGVINDDGQIRLYYGWSLAIPSEQAAAMGVGPEFLKSEQMLGVQQMMFGKSREEILGEAEGIMGANEVELEDNMLTIKGEVKRILPGQFAAGGTSFAGHAFYEASSIRKIGDTYYFIYSAQQNNQLCYATSRYPDRDFVYGGVIISNCDVEYEGRSAADALNLAGTNHGSIECIDGKWYIFYHRLTHGTDYSRQACAEEIRIMPDGSIPQVEVTSCGLNGGPLVAKGTYPAAIACNITNGAMPNIQFERSKVNTEVPCVSHEGTEHFITRITDGTRIGYKYFEFTGMVIISVMTRGSGTGLLEISDDEGRIGEISVHPSDGWTLFETKVEAFGVRPLYFDYRGEGSLELSDITFM